MKTNTRQGKCFPAIVCIVILVAGCGREASQELPYRGKPQETVTLERAQAMYKAYQPRFDSLTKIRGGEDARYGWQSLDFFKQYIAYVEHEAAKANIKVSGLRLYYVAYPEEDSLTNDQSGYQTYMFIPTYYDQESDTQIAFDPLHMDENGNPIRIHDVLVQGRPLGAKTIGLAGFRPAAAFAESESSFGNMAMMCKPNCE